MAAKPSKQLEILVGRTRHTTTGDSVEVDYPIDFERGAIWVPLYVLGGD